MQVSALQISNCNGIVATANISGRVVRKLRSRMRLTLWAIGFLFHLAFVSPALASSDASSSSSNALADSASSKGGLELGQVIKGPLSAPEASVLRAREAAVKDQGRYTTQGVSFDCSGLQCGATLYLPKAAPKTAAAGKGSGTGKGSSTGSNTKDTKTLPPVIVMAHGMGGEKAWLGKFAGAFAENGFAVLAFDYRHWGSSDGQPRQWVSIQKQHADWFAAVKHVQANMRSVVDADRLSLWGTSFAGGHVIVVASKLPGQVKAVISNVPHLDGAKATQANVAMRGARGNALVVMAALADIASDSKGGGQPVYIPLAGRIGSTAVMQLTEHDMAIYSAAHPQTEAQWQNLTRARIATEQTLSQYSPITYVDKVRAPLMVIAGKKDHLCPYASAVAAVAKAPKGTLVTFDVGHFDPYVEPTLGPSLAKQIEFLKQHAV